MLRSAKPPYTSVSDVDAFFERIQNIGEPKPPKKVDTAWVKNYDFETAHPSAIPSMLRWLGVINDQGESTGVWDKLRVDASRQATLEQMVRKAYKGIFDAVDVEKASGRDLRGAFVSVYSIGDSGRHIKCFLALCEQAGIKTAEAAHEREAKPKEKAATKPKPKAATINRPETTTRTPKPHVPEGVAITANVEIPADWTEEQIRERIATVTRAIGSAGQSDS